MPDSLNEQTRRGLLGPFKLAAQELLPFADRQLDKAGGNYPRLVACTRLAMAWLAVCLVTALVASAAWTLAQAASGVRSALISGDGPGAYLSVPCPETVRFGDGL